MPEERERRATVYVRSYTPISNPQNRVIQAAQSLSERGTFDDLAVESVPQLVRRTGEPTSVERRYEEFSNWATKNGFSISRPFRVRETKNRITGETVEKLVLPIVSLVVSEGEQVVAVLPCERDGDSLGVLDYLDALASGEDPLGTLSSDYRPVRGLANP